jgi:hypothetical protein
VPQDQFEAKYLKRPDGTGYSFEYRIPWKTLNPKAPLKAGDVVASTVQFNHSGQPAYPTVDGKGGWGADHGSPRAACAERGQEAPRHLHDRAASSPIGSGCCSS